MTMIPNIGDKFSQDEEGQWWYQLAGHSRKRAKVRTCPWCKREFLTVDVRRDFCSHSCAGASRHAGVKPTTPKTAKPGPSLGNSDNPHYTRDERGQWWYRAGKGGRTRAFVKECGQCEKPFLTCVFHNTDHCSRSCGLKALHAANPGQQAGERATNWKGGRRVVRGYVWVWNPDAAERMRPGTKKAYVLEHRLVMEQMLGRPLLPEENVHHKNGVRDDNRPANLELWTKHQLPGQRVKDLIEFARWVLETYEPVEKKLR